MNWLDYLRGRPAANETPAPAAASPAAPASGAADAADAPQPPLLIDVRTEREFMQGAVQGAVSLPLNRLGDDIRRLAPDPETPVVLYCATGARSGVGCNLLRGMGYRRVGNAGGVFEAAARLNRGLV